MLIKEIIRLYYIIRIFLKYGIDDFFVTKKFSFLLFIMKNFIFFVSRKYKKKCLGTRLKNALEILGPIWIKLGQLLSTRTDIFSRSIIKKISLLQDQTIPFDIKIVKKQIELSLKKPIKNCFKNFSNVPIASASISQVHSAILKENGKKIVVKILRPNILSKIKLDIKLMYHIVSFIQIFSKELRISKILEIIQEHEKTLLNELDLIKEAVNTIQLRKNFINSKMIYFPKVYINYCSHSVLVTERVYGTSISNIKKLKKNKVNMKLLAERGLQIFFKQVFRDSFFHADMHPGNIFINYQNPQDPKYIVVDCGIVGSLNKLDRRYIAENLFAFFKRDYRKIAELHINSGWAPNNINIIDFEFAIRIVFEPIFQKPLIKIHFSNLLIKLFNIARDFKISIQPQLLLLQKTLFYIEGVSRNLYPELNLWNTTKPFLEKWIKEQTNIELINTLKNKIPFFFEKLPQIPELLLKNIENNNIYQKEITKMVKIFLNKKRNKKIYLLINCIFFILLGIVFSFLKLKFTFFTKIILIIGTWVWLFSFLKL